MTSYFAWKWKNFASTKCFSYFLKICQNLKLFTLIGQFSLSPYINLPSTYSTNMLKSNWQIQIQDSIKLKMKVLSAFAHRLFKWISVLVGKGKKETRIKAHCHGRGASTAHPYCICSLYFIWIHLIDLRSDNCNLKLLN